MSNEFFGSLNFFKLDSLLEERSLSAMVAKRRKKELTEAQELNRNKFLLESRYEIFKDALSKAKLGSKEYDAILEQCINLFLEKNELKDYFDDDKRRMIVKFVKDEALNDEIVGEFDNKKNKKDENLKWPNTGRITLRDAIPKDMIGQNPDVPYSKNVTKMFVGNNKVDGEPSPSSPTKSKELKMEVIN